MISAAIDAPWKARLEAARLLAAPYVRARLALAGVEVGSGLKAFGAPIVQRHRGSRLVLGPRASLRSWPSSNPLAPSHRVVLSTRARGATLEIGADFGMTGGTIVAAERVAIGDRVLVGADCMVADTDFHPIGPTARKDASQRGATAPVAIEDDVFLGARTVVLKGVRIGAGSTIGAGSIVSRDVPAGSIAVGNPARVVGKVA